MTNEERANNYLTAYDCVLKLFQMNNDNYFKRTQIVMIVIQSALFVAFTNVITKFVYDSGTEIKWALFVVATLIIILGIILACVWLSFITRQGNYLEFGRCYLRGIESHLMELGIPLGYFTYESKVFYHPSRDATQEYVYFGINLEKFPHKCRKVKGHVIGVERLIARILMIFWIVFLVLSIILVICYDC